MTDRREEILSRVFEVLGAVDGVQACERNRDQLPANKRPAIVFLDGDEETHRSSDGRNRAPSSPVLVTLKPEIYLVLDSRKPQNELVGQDLNELRAKVLKALLTDATLKELCENIFLVGCMTDLARDRVMEGQMGIVIEFTYYLKPAEL